MRTDTLDGLHRKATRPQPKGRKGDVHMNILEIIEAYGEEWADCYYNYWEDET